MSSLQNCEETDLCLSNPAHDTLLQPPSEPSAGGFVLNEVLTINMGIDNNFLKWFWLLDVILRIITKWGLRKAIGFVLKFISEYRELNLRLLGMDGNS